ncbi:MAG TPA: hypothetical protein PKA38_01390 [Candidatus Levybacteria bacterium]|nr:hypothetical protein [Candidatus Levybacteria bacterium]
MEKENGFVWLPFFLASAIPETLLSFTVPTETPFVSFCKRSDGAVANFGDLSFPWFILKIEYDLGEIASRLKRERFLEENELADPPVRASGENDIPGLFEDACKPKEARPPTPTAPTVPTVPDLIIKAVYFLWLIHA